MINSTTGIITTILGPDSMPSALLSYPAGVSVGITGLYISDTNHNMVGELLLLPHAEVPTFCPSDTSIRSECTPVVACTICPSGMYAFGANSVVCSPCLEGTYSYMGSTTCSPCEAGSVLHVTYVLQDISLLQSLSALNAQQEVSQQSAAQVLALHVIQVRSSSIW